MKIKAKAREGTFGKGISNEHQKEELNTKMEIHNVISLEKWRRQSSIVKILILGYFDPIDTSKFIN